MDRLSPGDDRNQVPEPNRVDNSSTLDGSNSESTYHWDQAHALTAPPRLSNGHEIQPAPAEPWAVIERLDIDTAMVEALRSALASDHGSSGPGWAGSGPNPHGDTSRPTDLGILTQGPRELTRRGDIDLAVLDALRQAMGPDSEVPGA